MPEIGSSATRYIVSSELKGLSPTPPSPTGRESQGTPLLRVGSAAVGCGSSLSRSSTASAGGLGRREFEAADRHRDSGFDEADLRERARLQAAGTAGIERDALGEFDLDLFHLGLSGGSGIGLQFLRNMGRSHSDPTACSLLRSPEPL